MINLIINVSGPNISVSVNNGDRSGLTPDINNQIHIENVPDNTVVVDPNSTDRITGIVTQTTEG